MTDSTDGLMKSYEVIRSIVMRHTQYDAAKILTLNGEWVQASPSAVAGLGRS